MDRKIKVVKVGLGARKGRNWKVCKEMVQRAAIGVGLWLGNNGVG